MSEPERDRHQEINAALAAAQAEFPTIERNKTVTVKTQGGGSYTFSYADLGSILAAVRPVLARHGLAIVQRFDDTVGRVSIRTELRHEAGGVVGGNFPIENVPSSPQALGSLLTYLRRYSIVALLGIATEDDDDAGQAARPEGRSQFQAPPPREDGQVVDYLSEAQRKKIYALRGKLIKAGQFDEELFDEQLAEDYGASISGLTKVQASQLIERLVEAEKRLAPVEE